LFNADASDEALGAVVQQAQDGQIKIIVYTSRAFLLLERFYSTTTNELLGVIYGLKKFCHYLVVKQFKLRTDHAALTSLLKALQTVGQWRVG